MDNKPHEVLMRPLVAGHRGTGPSGDGWYGQVLVPALPTMPRGAQQRVRGCNRKAMATDHRARANHGIRFDTGTPLLLPLPLAGLN